MVVDRGRGRLCDFVSNGIVLPSSTMAWPFVFNAMVSLPTVICPPGVTVVEPTFNPVGRAVTVRDPTSRTIGPRGGLGTGRVALCPREEAWSMPTEEDAKTEDKSVRNNTQGSRKHGMMDQKINQVC